jgi:hypothetical protein
VTHKLNEAHIVYFQKIHQNKIPLFWPYHKNSEFTRIRQIPKLSTFVLEGTGGALGLGMPAPGNDDGWGIRRPVGSPRCNTFISPRLMFPWSSFENIAEKLRQYI